MVVSADYFHLQINLLIIFLTKGLFVCSINVPDDDFRDQNPNKYQRC